MGTPTWLAMWRREGLASAEVASGTIISSPAAYTTDRGTYVVVRANGVGCPTDAMGPVRPKFATSIAAKGRIFVAGDNAVYAFTLKQGRSVCAPSARLGHLRDRRSPRRA
jgi:hypothetical protein